MAFSHFSILFFSQMQGHKILCIKSENIFHCRIKRAAFKTLVDEVQELEAKSQDPGAVVHGKRYYIHVGYF